MSWQAISLLMYCLLSSQNWEVKQHTFCFLLNSGYFTSPFTSFPLEKFPCPPTLSFPHHTWIVLHISLPAPLFSPPLFHPMIAHSSFSLPSPPPSFPFSPLDQTHLLHLWRLFWARYKKTSRYEIPSSLICCFSVIKISNTKRSFRRAFLTIRRSENLHKPVSSISFFFFALDNFGALLLLLLVILVIC